MASALGGPRGRGGRSRILAGLAGLTLLLPLVSIRAKEPEASFPLPPLPERSERNANYTIEARLDPQAHTIDGRLVLEWRNTSGVPLSSFPFHLYWNAFRNTLSSAARGAGPRVPLAGAGPDKRVYGFLHVTGIRLLDPPGTDLAPTLRYLSLDDGNADDRTVMEVRTPTPVAPGETVRFGISWTSRMPYGNVGRAGWVHDYHFVAQWFPKIGVYRDGSWNCHQFHPWTEFFADYGVYDVRLTLPRGFVVGGTGRLVEHTDGPDGYETHHFFQEDVHDFAWTASRRFLERNARFEAPGYPGVEIRLLLQPEHSRWAQRYIDATKLALLSYGAWSAPYPYPQITVVDPAWGSASGGMEYPTLFTGGTSIFAPWNVLQGLEGLVIHEAGHQFWYGLVGNNEFEEAWLDEGFNRYHDEKTVEAALGPKGWERRYFGLRQPLGRMRGGLAVVAPGVRVGRGDDALASLRERGKVDVMARPGWTYRTAESYRVNAYSKPALTLQTLEALVGDDTMTRILRTYARRFRFRHPTSRDFIAVANEVAGLDLGPFFEQTWFSSDLCDYAVTARNEPARTLEGFTEGNEGRPVLVPGAGQQKADGRYDSEVTVLRLGEVRLPVEVLVELADGRRLTEKWDGQYRWTKYKYQGRVWRAVVDPDRKLAIDVNPSNNSWVDEQGVARRAACKWAARWMFWLQNLLELHTVLG